MTITVQELKTYLGRGQNDQSDESLLQWAVDSANAAISKYTGRTFAAPADPLPDATTRTYRAGSGTVYIDDTFDVELVEESSDNVNWTTVTGWWVEPFNTDPKYRLTGRCFGQFVRVTGQFGYGSIPPAARQAGLLIAHRIYKRKESPDGIAFGGEFAIRVSRFEDPDAARLLDPLRRVDGMIA